MKKKKTCTPINPQKIFMLWPKKKTYKEFDNKKKFLRLENSPLPRKSSNGPSLSGLKISRLWSASRNLRL